MAKDEWGVKRICPSCGVRFYDLGADPVTCPSCESSFTLESLTERRPTAISEGRSKPKKEKAAAEPASGEDEDLLEGEDEDEDEDLDIDDDVLIDDDDDDDEDDLGEIGDVKGKGDDEG